ncbi:MAG: tRNA (N(6)-L-threonylcarbamoyladenosine(37)-C(2))-methylthiotransferase [Candidatus Pacearchaeota archaeon]|nr:MAG: tRNA (N(6)-L-threonylcarbamoyladenosine(37)-C(2))-methylthiotransferase [Candidatus Pacearchaeota archaeon]
MNIYIETYGCSANQSDGEIMKGLLSRSFSITENEKLANIIILNTCIVKGPTLKRMESRIKHFSRKRLIVSGCMPEVLSERIRKLAPKASMISTHHVKQIVKVVKNIIEDKKVELIGKKKEVKLCMPKIPKNKIIGITQLSNGCLGNCAYCIVKNVKGNLFSYPQDKILKDIKQNLRAGCKEIWLTSQDNAAYGLDNGKNELPILLKKILFLKNRFFIRLGMMNPSTLLPVVNEIIDCYKNKKMFKFLHLPVQSGSDKILKLMNRGYRVKDFIKIVEKFKREIPDLTLSTDIIVGFPSESKEDFEKTLALVKKIKPDIINISKYWPMPRTSASEMKQLDEKEKKKRAFRLMKLHQKIALEKNEKLVGKRIRIFVDAKGFDDTWLARTMNYKVVVLKGKKLLGRVVDIEIRKVTSHYLMGVLLE